MLVDQAYPGITATLLSPWMNNYYHFMTDYIPRLALYSVAVSPVLSHTWAGC